MFFLVLRRRTRLGGAFVGGLESTITLKFGVWPVTKCFATLAHKPNDEPFGRTLAIAISRPLLVHDVAHSAEQTPTLNT